MSKTKISNNTATIDDDIMIVIETMTTEKRFIFYLVTLYLEYCDKAEKLQCIEV